MRVQRALRLTFVTYAALTAIIATPIGDMLALASDEGLCALEFTTVAGPAARRSASRGSNARLAPLVSAARDRRRRDADASRARASGWPPTSPARRAEIGDLPLDMRGAPFEKRVWTALGRSRPADDQLRRDRAGARIRRRLARGRRRQRRESGGDHRALPSRHRLDRIADRLRRRPRSQDVADRPRAPLAPRTASVAVLNHETTRNPRDLSWLSWLS